MHFLHSDVTTTVWTRKKAIYLHTTSVISVLRGPVFSEDVWKSSCNVLRSMDKAYNVRFARKSITTSGMPALSWILRESSIMGLMENIWDSDVIYGYVTNLQHYTETANILLGEHLLVRRFRPKTTCIPLWYLWNL